jgi:hypothetical protein
MERGFTSHESRTDQNFSQKAATINQTKANELNPSFKMYQTQTQISWQRTLRLGP